MARIGMIGAGSWGTALAAHLAGCGHRVEIWSIMKDEVDMINNTHQQSVKLPGVILDESVTASTDLEQVMRDKDMLVLAVPSAFTRSTAKNMAKYCRYGQLIVSVAKGIEEDTLLTLTEVIKEEIPHCVQSVFMGSNFRVYTSPDMLGMQVGAALKNVIALAAGCADGLGCGDNTKAALITRGIAEISQIGIAMGGKPETFSGLTGIGDLIVTCASMHSRNRRAGILIGKGMTADEAMEEVKQVVEGVYSAKAALQLADKYDVEAPIIRTVSRVLFGNEAPGQAVEDLMLREGRVESSGLQWQ